jgi:hypothetical protein
MGARFLAIGLIVSVVWYTWHPSSLSIDAVSLRILLWSVLAACAGKIVGIVRFSWRQRTLCLKTIQ